MVLKKETRIYLKKDGWTDVSENFSIYCENGCVMRGNMDNRAVYPYIPNMVNTLLGRKQDGWVNAEGISRRRYHYYDKKDEIYWA